jgi:hypothetical protein
MKTKNETTDEMIKTIKNNKRQVRNNKFDPFDN